jgi:hypothetical protein
MLPAYPLVLAVASADGTALTASTTATSILHASGKATLPAGSLQVGSIIKATLRGRMSNIATTPGTLTLDMRFGAVIISALGALNLNTAVNTNASFELELLAVIRALGTGTSANALVTGRMTSRSLIGSALVAAGGNQTIILPDTAPAVGTGFDSTASQAIDIFATWSLNNANSIQVHQSILELKV